MAKKASKPTNTKTKFVKVKDLSGKKTKNVKGGATGGAGSGKIKFN